jgi:hypothetical protein
MLIVRLEARSPPSRHPCRAGWRCAWTAFPRPGVAREQDGGHERSAGQGGLVDADGFDSLTRVVLERVTRRAVLGVVAGTLGITVVGTGDLEAKKRKKRKRQRPPSPLQPQPQPQSLPAPPRNAFGCVDVGQPCQGDHALCCSGICAGAAPTGPDQPDPSRCIAHDGRTCLAGVRSDSCGASDVSCTTSAGLAGFCETTTGLGAFCAYAGECRLCTKDVECQGEFGPHAACIVCSSCPGGTSCGFPDDR